MLERFNVDMLAGAITAEVMTGEPVPKLPHRFFRKGRRDGIRQLIEHPIRQMIVAAVSTASSRIESDLRSTEAGLKKARAELWSELEILEEKVTKGVPELELEVPDRFADAPKETATEFASRQNAKLAKNSVKIQEHAKAVQEFGDAIARVNELKVEIAGLDSQMSDLTAVFGQQVATCRQVGAILWSRYASGYEYGQRRRWRRSKSTRDINLDIEFEGSSSRRSSNSQLEGV